LNVGQLALEAMGQDTFRTAVSIEEGVVELSTSMKDVRDAGLFGKVLKRLTAPNSDVNHEAARNKHEQATRNWFLELDEFTRWKQGQIRSIWIHGIPGAGKTSLLSTIVEHVKSVFEVGANKLLLAFFYFDFNDSDKRTVIGMLRSVLHQFCIQSMRHLTRFSIYIKSPGMEMKLLQTGFGRSIACDLPYRALFHLFGCS
jgi:hypothetical protein